MFCFIILHFANVFDTLECIKSISNIKTKKQVKIIVVDNNSLSEENLNIIKPYDVKIIKLPKNIGFAKANNIGCKYAIEEYDPDFLAVINNDTVIHQQEFIDNIYMKYKQNNFDILGPKILTKNGFSVNPFPVFLTKRKVFIEIVKAAVLILIYKTKFFIKPFENYINKKIKTENRSKLLNSSFDMCNVPLHGCALIFSKQYFMKYRDVFYNGTFLYHEEEFLYYRVVKDKLISNYSVSLEIFHKEGSTLKTSNISNSNKIIFQSKHKIYSLIKLLVILILKREV